jgi:integrase
MASIQKRPDGRWRARYRDANGKEHAKHFDRKVDAQRWVDEVTASIVTGQYVDPSAARVTFKEYAESWRQAQVHRESSAAHVETMLRRHAYPAFGSRQLGAIRPGEVQSWVKKLSTGSEAQRGLAPATVAVIHGLVAAVFKAAVRDRKLPPSPCEGIKLPKQEPRQIVPLATAAVRSLAEAVPARYSGLITLAAGTGRRQGEAFGLTLDRVDFLRRTLTVDRQLILLAGQEPRHGPPKTRASYRVLPLPQVVLEALAEHLREFPVTDNGLVFTNEAGAPLNRTRFSASVRRPAVKHAGLEGVTFHDLRHYYASLLIRHGESVKVVQARLGHATAAETLDTYSHLWPDSENRTREAIDAVVGAPADSLRTDKAAEH